MTLGGGGNLAYEYTEDVRQHMSEINRNRIYSPERNERIRQSMIGREYLPEWREALSKARIGQFGGENNSFYGKHHTIETKERISNANSKFTIYQIHKDTEEILNIFKNSMDAARWIVDNGYSKANPGTCVSRILLVCRSKNSSCTAYGFKWKLEEKSID